MNFDKEIFVIAEIGGNHEGDFEYAKKLLADAADSGAHAVKFQTYTPDKIVSKVENEVRNKHFGKFALSDEQFIELAELAKKKGIMFMSSIWDLDSLEVLDKYIEVHKVGSGDITNYPMLKALALKNKPLIIATAMSNLDEVRETVEFIRSVNPKLIEERKLVLLQCVAMYGEPKDEYAQLAVIETYRNEFPDVVIGYSDHTKGIFAAQHAVAMGARVLEIHFTDDKTREFRDHHFSVTKEEMRELMNNINRYEVMSGSSVKKPVLPIEDENRIWEFRRSCYFKVDMNAGETVSEENLTTLRPNKGIDARKYYELIGKKLKIDKKAFEALDYDDFE